MTKDWMKRATFKNYTAWDIGFACYRRGDKRKLEKQFKRSARRNDKMMLKGLM